VNPDGFTSGGSERYPTVRLMKLESEYRLNVQPYACRPNPMRLSVGDVIRCSAFRLGIQFHRQDAIMVGWRDETHPSYHASVGNGRLVHDETRGRAQFLVVSLRCIENSGPEDAVPEARISINVQCLRLTNQLQLQRDAELIEFSQFEPMNVAQPALSEIELVGYAALPIGL
jgi:hypothetical protein